MHFVFIIVQILVRGIYKIHMQDTESNVALQVVGELQQAARELAP